MNKLNEKLIITPGNYGNVVIMSGGSGCLEENTLVKTEDGYIPIKDVKKGQLVYSYNEKDNSIELKEVHEVFDNGMKEIIQLTFEDGTIVECTEDHKFFVDGEWVEAGNLSVAKDYIGKKHVYDLNIEDNHSYLITKRDIIVHNSGKGRAIKSYLETGKYKVRDVDYWKTAFLKLARLKDKYPEIRNLNLRNPQDVFTLHEFIANKGIKQKTLDLLLKDVSEDRLPNIIFDITGKSIFEIVSILPTLHAVGYDPKKINLIWILTNYRIAIERNRKRSRTVPDDIVLKTHEGAAKTFISIMKNDSEDFFKYLDGGIYVILGDTEHIVYYDDEKVNIKDFTYFQMKKPGKSPINYNDFLDKLYHWLEEKVPERVLIDI